MTRLLLVLKNIINVSTQLTKQFDNHDTSSASRESTFTILFDIFLTK